MSVQRGKLVSGGRLQIPVEIRRELGLADGDAVTMSVVDGELRVRSKRDAIARLQARMAPYAPKDGTLVSEELIAERHAEAERE